MSSLESLQNQPVPFEIKLGLDERYAENTFGQFQPFIEIVQNHLDAVDGAWVRLLCESVGINFKPNDLNFGVFADSVLRYSYYQGKEDEASTLPEISLANLVDSNLYEAEIGEKVSAIREFIESVPRQLPKIKYFYEIANGLTETQGNSYIEIEHGGDFSILGDQRYRLAGIRFEDSGRGYDKNVLATIGLTTKASIPWNRGGLGEGLKVGFNRLVSQGCQVKLGSKNSLEKWDGDVIRQDTGIISIKGEADPNQPNNVEPVSDSGSYTEVWFPKEEGSTNGLTIGIDPRYGPGIAQLAFGYDAEQGKPYVGDTAAITKGNFSKGLYVRGLRICDLPRCFASYNIASKEAIIGRDRSGVSEDIFKEVLRQIITQNTEPQYAVGLIQSIRSTISYQEFEVVERLSAEDFKRETLQIYMQEFRKVYPGVEGKKTVFFTKFTSPLAVANKRSQGHNMQYINEAGLSLAEFFARVVPDEVEVLPADYEDDFVPIPVDAKIDITAELNDICVLLDLLGVKTRFGWEPQGGHSSSRMGVWVDELNTTYTDALWQTKLRSDLIKAIPRGYALHKEVMPEGGNPFFIPLINPIRSSQISETTVPLHFKVERSPRDTSKLPDIAGSGNQTDGQIYLNGSPKLDYIVTLALILREGAYIDLVREGQRAEKLTQNSLGQKMVELLKITQPDLVTEIGAKLRRLYLPHIAKPIHPLEKLSYKSEKLVADLAKIALAKEINTNNRQGITPKDMEDWQDAMMYPYNRYDTSDGTVYKAHFGWGCRRIDNIAVVPPDKQNYSFRSEYGPVHVRDFGGMHIGRYVNTIIEPFTRSIPVEGGRVTIHSGALLINENADVSFIGHDLQTEPNHGLDLIPTNLDINYGEKVWNSGARVIGDILQNHRDADPASNPNLTFKLRGNQGEIKTVGLDDVHEYPVESWQIIGIEITDNGDGYSTSNLTTLGKSSKASGDSGGIHGEGLKMLVLSCLRNGIDLELASRNWHATPKRQTHSVTDHLVGDSIESERLSFAMQWLGNPRRGSMTYIGLPQDSSHSDLSIQEVWKEWISKIDPRIAANSHHYRALESLLRQDIIDPLTGVDPHIYEHGRFVDMSWPQNLPKPVIGWNFNTNISGNRERTHMSEEVIRSAMGYYLSGLGDVEVIAKIIKATAGKNTDSLETSIAASVAHVMTPAAKAAWRTAYYREFGWDAVLMHRSDWIEESYLPDGVAVKLPPQMTRLMQVFVTNIDDYKEAAKFEEEVELSDLQRDLISGALDLLTDLVIETFEYGIKIHPGVFSDVNLKQMEDYILRLKNNGGVFRIVNSALYKGQIMMDEAYLKLNLSISILSDPLQFIDTVLHELFHYVSRAGDYTGKFDRMFAAFIALRCEMDADKLWLKGNVPDLGKKM